MKKPEPSRAEPTKPKRRWARVRRWMKRLALAGLLLALVARIALPYALPRALTWLGQSRGLAIVYEDLHLALLAGEVSLSHLDVRPLATTADEAPEPLLHVDFVDFDLDVTELFTGTVRVRRAVLDGVTARVEREADGRFQFERFLAPAAAPDAAAPQPATDGPAPDAGAKSPREAGAIDFTPPVRIDAARVQHLRLLLIDRALTTPLESEFLVDVRLSDLGVRDRPARIEVAAHSPQLLDRFHLEGQFRGAKRELEATLAIALDGFRPRPLAGLLAVVGVEPLASEIDGRFRLDARCTAAAAASSDDAHDARGTLRIEDVLLRADVEEAFAIDLIEVDVPRLAAHRIDCERVALSGVRGSAQRLADGAFAAGGFALRPVAEVASAPSSAASAPSDAPSTAPPVLSVKEVTLDGGVVRFDDAAVAPNTSLVAALESLRLSGFVLDPAQPDAELTLAVRGGLAGVAESLTFDVVARPFGAHRTLDARFAATALDGVAIAPYLALAGLAPDFGGGAVRAGLSGQVNFDDTGAVTAEFGVEDFALEPGAGQPAVRLGSLRLAGLALAADRRTLRIESLKLRAPTFEGARDEAGIARAFGLRTLSPEERAARPQRPHATPPAAGGAPGAVASEEAAPGESASPEAPRALPRFELFEFTVEGASLRVTDAHTAKPVDLALTELGLVVTDLALGGDSARETPDRGRIDASLRAAGLARSLSLAGTLTSVPGPLDVAVELELRGDGLVTDLVDPWLDELGLESTLTDGALTLTLRAKAAALDEGTRVEASLTDLSWRDSGRELCAVDALAVDEAILGDGFLRIGTVALRGPRLAAARAADGSLELLGLRLRAAAPVDSANPAPADAASIAPPPADGARATSAAGGAPAAPPAPPLRIALAKLELADARLAWRDDALGAPIETALTASGALESVHIAEPGEPARFRFGLALAGAVDALRLDGDLDLTGDARTLHARLSGEGLRAGPLAPYLPPGVEVRLTDGRIAGTLAFEEGPAQAGGRRIALDVTDFSLRDGQAGAPLAALARLRLDAPRVDAVGRVYELAELTTEGLVLDLERTGPTTLEGLGIAFTSAAVAPSENERAPGAATQLTAPSGSSPSDAAPGERSEPAPLEAPRTLIVGLSGVASDDLPTVDVGVLSLGIDRFRFTDRTSSDAVPLELRAHLVLPAPTRLLGPAPEALPALVLVVEGAAPPFVRASTVRVELSPFAPTPTLLCDVDVRGISGPGLASVVPDLTERVDLTGLVDGRISAHLDARFDVQRRGAAAFDLSRGLGVVVSLEDAGMRATEDGEVLLGVERVYIDAPRIRPATGDLSVRTVEVTRPILRARKTAEGIEALGVLVRNAAPAEATDTPSAAPPVSSAAPAEPEVAATTDAAPGPAPSRPVVRIDELLVSGASILVEDASVTPPLVVPITDLDVEVRGFTTRPGAAPISVRAYVEAGRVPLPERSGGDSLVTGILSAAAGMVTGRDDSFTPELRPLWESLQVTGRVSLDGETPKGFVTVALEAFELPALRGPAKAAGIDIGDGLVDTRVALRLLGERGLRIDTRTVFSHLFVSEPPGGPISKYLALPAPLDTVLYVLRDENEQQVLPLSVSIPPEGVSVPRVLASVTTLLGELILEAIASSPLRIGTGALGALGLAGLLGGDEPPPMGAPLSVSFGPLDGALDERSQLVLAGLAADLRLVPGRKVRLIHELGGGDLTAAEAATVLEPEALRELGAALVGARDALSVERDVVAADVRGQLAVGRTAAAEARRRELVELDERLAETESALDQVYGLLRPGAGRDSARRARAISVLLGQQRLEAVRDVLVEGGLPPTRIELRRPRAGTPQDDGGGRVLVEQK